MNGERIRERLIEGELLGRLIHNDHDRFNQLKLSRPLGIQLPTLVEIGCCITADGQCCFEATQNRGLNGKESLRSGQDRQCRSTPTPALDE